MEIGSRVFTSLNSAAPGIQSTKEQRSKSLGGGAGGDLRLNGVMVSAAHVAKHASKVCQKIYIYMY